MPQERRRRRVRTGPGAAAAELRGAPRGGPRGAPRPWWKPTPGVFTAFFAGFWLAGTFAFSDDAQAVVFFLGVIGLALGLARLLRLRLMQRRRERIAAGREADAEGAEDGEG